MATNTWEQHFNELALNPNTQDLIPVRQLERNSQPDQRIRQPLAKYRSGKSLLSTTGTVRSFHRPFYADNAGSVATSSRSADRAIESPPPRLVLTIPGSRTTAKLPSVVPQSDLATTDPHFSENPESTSSISTSDTLPTPDDIGAYFDDLDAAFECGAHSPQDRKACVVSPDDWVSRFYSEPPKGPASLDQTDECPDRATLAAVQDLPVYSSTGDAVPFGSLYDSTLAPSGSSLYSRQLVIFIRHFHCGACQAYVRALTNRISFPEYFSIPVPTSFIVIGCGRPSMIRYYRRATGCPWPIYADPSRRLFRKLGMAPTLHMGAGTPHPDYLPNTSVSRMWTGSISRVAKEYTDLVAGELGGFDWVKGGNIFQVGGEFLFEDGQVVWCHRMKHWRGHAEVGALRKLLELDL